MPAPRTTRAEALTVLRSISDMIPPSFSALDLYNDLGGWGIRLTSDNEREVVALARRLGAADTPANDRSEGGYLHVTRSLTYGRVPVTLVVHRRLVRYVAGHVELDPSAMMDLGFSEP